MAELVGADWNQSDQKRFFDVAGMTALLPVLGSIGVASAAAIAGIDRMNPIYTSTRYGLDGEPFDCHKLRTMPPTTTEAPSLSGHADSRATKLGSILRKAHFDEIPQAINIYRGDMSLVGPRPLIAHDMEATMDILSPAEQNWWTDARATAKPAPFGLHQLHQHANDYSSSYEQTLRERALYDIEYANTASFKGDIKIIADSITEGIGSYLFSDSGTDLNRNRLTGLFNDIAISMGVHLDTDEQKYWKSFLVAARDIDDVIDTHDDVNVEGMLHDLLAGKPIGDMTPDEAAEFADMYWQLPPLKRQRLLTAFMALPIYQQRKRDAGSAKELARAFTEESRLFASILHVDTDDRLDAAERERFNKWLGNFSHASYLADGAFDMHRDYESGVISIAPTIAGRLHLLQQGFIEGSAALRSVPASSLRRLATSAVYALNTGK